MNDLVERIMREGGYFFFLWGGLKKLDSETDEQARIRALTTTHNLQEGKVSSFEFTHIDEYYVAGHNLKVRPSAYEGEDSNNPLVIGLSRSNIQRGHHDSNMWGKISNEQLIYGSVAKQIPKEVPHTKNLPLTGLEKTLKFFGAKVKPRQTTETKIQSLYEGNLQLNEIVSNAGNQDAYFLLFNFCPRPREYFTPQYGRTSAVAQIMVAVDKQLCDDVVNYLTKHPQDFVPLALNLFPRKEFPALNKNLFPSIKPFGQLQIMNLPINIAVFGNYWPQEVAKLSYGK